MKPFRKKIKWILENQRGVGKDCKPKMPLGLAIAFVINEVKKIIPKKKKKYKYNKEIIGHNICQQKIMRAISEKK